MATREHATIADLDEVAEVLQAVGNAPRVSLEPGWALDIQPDSWRIIVQGGDGARAASHQTLVGAGVGLEHLVIALEAHHHHVEVQELPVAEPAAAGNVRLVGPGHPSSTLLQMQDLSQHPHAQAPVRDVQPSDLRVLNLTAEAFAAEVMWSSDLESRRELRGQQRVHPVREPSPYATIVTPGDSPADWLHTGRALARLLLRASALGLEAHLELQVLGQAETRLELRSTWGLTGFPQAQFTLTGQRLP